MFGLSWDSSDQPADICDIYNDGCNHTQGLQSTVGLDLSTFFSCSRLVQVWQSLASFNCQFDPSYNHLGKDS